MKKTFSVIIASLMVLSILGGCASKTKNSTINATTSAKIVIGYANSDDTDVFCTSRKTAFNTKIKTDSNIKVEYSDARSDINKQLGQIDNFIAEKVKAIFIIPVDYDGIVTGIKKANAVGIPVICIGNQSSGGEYTFIGSDNYDAGKMQGEFMLSKLPKNAKIVILQGTSGLYHAKERLQGFTDACIDKRPDVKVLSSIDGNYDRAEGLKIVEEWIQIFPKFDAVIAANDQMALGAIQALKTAKRLQGVLISGVDGTIEARNAIEVGEMSQTINQDAIAQADKSYEVLQTIIKANKPPKQILIPFESITKDNVDKFLN